MFAVSWSRLCPGHLSIVVVIFYARPEARDHHASATVRGTRMRGLWQRELHITCISLVMGLPFGIPPLRNPQPLLIVVYCCSYTYAIDIHVVVRPGLARRTFDVRPALTEG